MIIFVLATPGAAALAQQDEARTPVQILTGTVEIDETHFFIIPNLKARESLYVHLENTSGKGDHSRQS